MTHGRVESFSDLLTFSLPIALASGGWILVLVIVVILAGVIYGFYTRTGSGIEEHPLDSREQAGGGEGASEVSGKDEGEGSALDTHGTR